MTLLAPLLILPPIIAAVWWLAGWCVYGLLVIAGFARAAGWRVGP